jgi:RHS repeat-associated protein
MQAPSYDSETGLYYYRARYYDPGTGRFVSQDPISFAGRDANLYRYVGNAPTTKKDPTGKWSWAACGGGVVTGGTVGTVIGGPIGGAIGAGLGCLAGGLLGRDDFDASENFSVGLLVGVPAGVVGGGSVQLYLWCRSLYIAGGAAAATQQDRIQALEQEIARHQWLGEWFNDHGFRYEAQEEAAMAAYLARQLSELRGQ